MYFAASREHRVSLLNSRYDTEGSTLVTSFHGGRKTIRFSFGRYLQKYAHMQQKWMKKKVNFDQPE